MSEIVEIDNLGKGFSGKRVDKEIVNELDHFYTCPDCGQSVDMRDLGQVFHHEEKGHSPLTREA